MVIPQFWQAACSLSIPVRQWKAAEGVTEVAGCLLNIIMNQVAAHRAVTAPFSLYCFRMGCV